MGYGADPNPVVDWVRDNCAAVVRGNHDRVCTGPEDLEWFNPVARYAALWTMQDLTDRELDYTAALPKGPLMLDGFQVVHGSPFDEDEYVISAGRGVGRLSNIWKAGWRFSGTPTCRAASSGITRGWKPSAACRRAAARTWISTRTAPT